MATGRDERERIRAYFDSQSPSDPAVHLEKAATENVGGIVHEIWDVHTASGRWWVVTNPTNLYTQDDFKSRDVVLTFHLGLAMRVASQYRQPINELPAMLLDEPWRRWERAVEAMTSAAHPEDFQAVSLRLRECLVSLVEQVQDDTLIPAGGQVPKGASREWIGLFSARMAPGGSESRLRDYLKDLGERTWDLAQKVTHRRTADHLDAEIAVAAVSHLLSTYTAAWMRWERNGGRRCPQCGSYSVTNMTCERCGTVEPSAEAWTLVPINDDELARRLAEPCTPSSDISTLISPEDY